MRLFLLLGLLVYLSNISLCLLGDSIIKHSLRGLVVATICWYVKLLCWYRVFFIKVLLKKLPCQCMEFRDAGIAVICMFCCVYVLYISPLLSLSLFHVPFISWFRVKLVTMIAHSKIFLINLSVFTQPLQIICNSMVRIHRIFLCGLRLPVWLPNLMYLSYQQWSILCEENHDRSG